MNKVENYLVPYDARTHCVYAHINKVNGKIYFGITKDYPKYRWGGGSGYVKSTKFYTAIKKYGWDGFDHVVILRNLSKSEALYLEESFISLYNTTDRRYGYNTDKGGKDCSLSKISERKLIEQRKIRPIICLETKERYKSLYDFAAQTGEDHSYVKESCKSKGSRVHKNKHYLYIEDYVQLTLEQIQDIIEGKYQNHKEVVCMETGEVFWDATKAGERLPYGKFSVSNRCNHFKERGRDNFAGGFHWAYKEDYDKLTKDDIDYVINLDNFKVVCLETKKVYINPVVAAKETGASENSIRSCCKGTLRFSNNLHWMYEKDYKRASKEDIERIFKKERKKIESIRIKKVVCLETGEIYENMKEAAKEKGASESNISISCKRGNGLKSGGYHWMFEEDYKKATKEEVERRKAKRKVEKTTAKSVICLETGEEFRKASEVKGISTGSITSCCLFYKNNKERKKRTLTAGGFHWLYKEDYDVLSEEERQKILKINKENYKSFRKKSTYSQPTKVVINLSTKSKYSSVREASEKTGYHADSIRQACKASHHTLFGEMWLYEEDFKRLNEVKIKELVQRKNKRSFKKVICLETGEVFKGASEACRKYSSTNSSCIISCCSGVDSDRLTAAGLHWMYYNDYLRTPTEVIKNRIKIKRGRKIAKSVIKLETMEVFPSIEAACAKFGISNKTIRYSCTGERKTHKKNGHWMFKADYDKASQEDIDKRLNT